MTARSDPMRPRESTMAEDDPGPVETLRLLKAFVEINDPVARRTVLAMAEMLASGEPVTAETLASLINDAQPS